MEKKRFDSSGFCAKTEIRSPADCKMRWFGRTRWEVWIRTDSDEVSGRRKTRGQPKELGVRWGSALRSLEFNPQFLYFDGTNGVFQGPLKCTLTIILEEGVEASIDLVVGKRGSEDMVSFLQRQRQRQKRQRQ